MITNSAKPHKPDKNDVRMDELYEGYRQCRKRKRSTEQEQDFSIFITENLAKLRNGLLYRNYRPDAVRTFLVYKPVLREIFAPEFRDRVDHHYLAAKLEPMLERELIHDCYSCRKGKGTLFGIKRLRRSIARCSANYTRDCYILSCDIKGYFMSINREQLWNRLEAFIRRNYTGTDIESFLWQMHTFLFTSPLENVLVRGNRKRWADLPDNKSLFACSGAPKPCDFDGDYDASMDMNRLGLTIGALLSQMLGNFYLSPFDHYCKSVEGLRFYGRYVDDFYIVHEDAAFLKALVPRLRAFLHSMGLTLHPHKVSIVHYRQGVPFLGAFVKGAALLPGKRIRGNFRVLLHIIENLPDYLKHTRTIEDYTAKLNSYLGMLKNYNARMYVRKMLDRHPRVRFFFHITPDLGKAVSHRTLLHKQHLYIRRETARQYHRQFLRRNASHPMRTRAQIYTDLWFLTYGVLPRRLTVPVTDEALSSVLSPRPARHGRNGIPLPSLHKKRGRTNCRNLFLSPDKAESLQPSPTKST